MTQEAIEATYVDGLIEITGDNLLDWEKLTRGATKIERIEDGLVGWGFADIYRIEHYNGMHVGTYLTR